jgi:predicted small metal-binding protein
MRKMIDCRELPSEKNCTLTIAGEEEEVVRAAVLHGVDVHGHKDTPDFRSEIRRSLKDERPPASGR